MCVIRTSTGLSASRSRVYVSDVGLVLAAEYANHASLGQCSFVEGDSGQRALHSHAIRYTDCGIEDQRY